MKQRTGLTILLIVGILLTLGPVWGMLGTVVGMTLAFVHLDEAEPQPEALADDIAFAMFTTVAGWIACPIGIAIIAV